MMNFDLKKCANLGLLNFEKINPTAKDNSIIQSVKNFSQFINSLQ